MDSQRFIRKHENLEVWQDSMTLVESIYKATARFPIEEKFGLTNQMRRASVSIPSNIAEGASRSSIRDYLRFLTVSRSSLVELETQIQIAERLKYLPDAKNYLDQSNRVFAKLSALINTLNRKLA